MYILHDVDSPTKLYISRRSGDYELSTDTLLLQNLKGHTIFLGERIICLSQRCSPTMSCTGIASLSSRSALTINIKTNVSDPQSLLTSVFPWGGS